MKKEEIREAINNFAVENETEVMFLDEPSFDNSIIGITDDGRLIYHYDKMVEEFKKDNKCTREEAMEWIDFNVIRSLSYKGAKAPIIARSLL